MTTERVRANLRELSGGWGSSVGKATKQKEVRHLDMHEREPFDEAQIASWIGHAAALPGWLQGGSGDAQ